jgi:hypothetical protein
MRRPSILAATLALAVLSPAPAAASVFYTFTATTGSNVISWTTHTSNFVTSTTAISAADLDTCAIFPSGTCLSVTLDPFNSTYDLVTTIWDDGSGTPPALGSYFPDGALGAPGVYFGLNDELLSVSGTPDAPAVPEPASWALMILGFGAVGFAMRWKRKLAFVAHK